MTAIEPYRGDAPHPVTVAPPAQNETPRGSDNIDIAGVAAAFRRHIPLFLITLAATLGLTMAFLWATPPQYTATARVAVESRTLQPTPDKEAPVVSQLSTKQTADVQTEAQVIQSIRVVERVVDTLHLEKDPEFNGTRTTLKGRTIKFLLAMFAPVKAKSQRDEVINNVMANLRPAQYLATNAIDINYTDNNAKKAQRIANAFAKAYLEDQVAAKAQQSAQANDGILSQIAAMRRQADDDAAKVQAYKVSHNLMSVGALTLTEQEISGYDQSVAAAKAEAAGDLANLHTAQDQLARGSNGEDVGQALASPTVGHLREQRAEVSATLARLQAHYGPKYPDLAQARQQLADIDQEIKAEIQRTISNLAAKSAVSQKRLETLEGTLATAKKTLAENNAAQAGLEALTREAAVSQQLYEAYLSRSKESVAQAANVLPDAAIVSRAILPEYPSFPNTILFLALGIVAGVLFGCAAVLIAEMTESRLMTAEDVEARLGLPCLGAIPLLASVSRAPRGAPQDVLVSEPASAFAESFRSLWAAIGFSTRGVLARVVLVTSALPQEGKTTVSIGLARTTALQGVATVLVDCDVRRAGVTRGLRLGDGPGLTDVLAGRVELHEALVPDAASGAMVLPTRTGESSVHELLAGEAMDQLLDQLRTQFEVVLLDAPPALPIAATRLLAAKADACVLIARWRKTREAAVRSALRLLLNDQVRLVGIGLDRVDMRQMSKYGYADSGRFFSKFKQYYA